LNAPTRRARSPTDAPGPAFRVADGRFLHVVASGALCYNVVVTVGKGKVNREDHITWMRLALAEATQAMEHGDIPVGAVAVREGRVVGRGHNRKEADKDPIAHAEILTLQEAARTLGGWRLVGVTLYCTLEPCPMCAGAMLSARLPYLVYGADDPKAGAAGSVVELLRDPRFNHRVAVVRGVLAKEAQELLAQFFARLRET